MIVWIQNIVSIAIVVISAESATIAEIVVIARAVVDVAGKIGNLA
jgi:hypothetical protein